MPHKANMQPFARRTCNINTDVCASSRHLPSELWNQMPKNLFSLPPEREEPVHPRRGQGEPLFPERPVAPPARLGRRHTSLWKPNGYTSNTEAPGFDMTR